MLYFNVRRVMEMRGIAKPFAFLLRNGFIRSTAVNFMNGNAELVKVAHIQKLCLLLNCTPSDLFDWQQTAKSPALDETQALKSLAREKSVPTLSEIVKDLSIEKVEEISAMIKQMKDKPE